MGYNTDFKGSFTLDRELDDETYKLLVKLSETRRMKRKVSPIYGVDGEFYMKDDNEGIINFNSPPRTQPSLWCGWIPTQDKLGIEWNGSEKFYSYIEWITYIIDRILVPNDYILNGEVEWIGEERNDMGKIVVTNNVVQTKCGRITYD